MSRRLAPVARRTPISRVRSKTEASRTFMMPMPPTKREMPVIDPIRSLNTSMLCCACRSRSLRLASASRSASPAGRARIQAVARETTSAVDSRVDPPSRSEGRAPRKGGATSPAKRVCGTHAIIWELSGLAVTPTISTDVPSNVIRRPSARV
jgi:hypothetical protein